MTTAADPSHLVRAVNELPRRRRHAVLFAMQRDHVQDPREREFWNALAALVADVDEEERANLSALEDNLSGARRSPDDTDA